MPQGRRWDFSSAAIRTTRAGSNAAATMDVEPPPGYAKQGGQQQQVQEARASKASIEEVKKERQMKQRVSCLY